jgi:hypothetical protein
MVHPADQQLGRERIGRQPLAGDISRAYCWVSANRASASGNAAVRLLGPGLFHGREARVDALAAQCAHIGIGMPRQRGPLAQGVGLDVQRLQAPGAVAFAPVAWACRARQMPEASRAGAGGQRAGEQAQRRVVDAFGLFPHGTAPRAGVRRSGRCSARCTEGAGQALDQGRGRCAQGGMGRYREPGQHVGLLAQQIVGQAAHEPYAAGHARRFLSSSSPRSSAAGRVRRPAGATSSQAVAISTSAVTECASR